MDENGEQAVKHPEQSQEKSAAGRGRGFGRPFRKGKGDDRDPRIQPGPGRPPNEASIAYWMKQFAAMSPAEAAEKCRVYADQFALRQETIPIAAIIAARALLDLMNEPQASLLNVIMERTESDGAALPVTVIIGSSKWTPK